MGIPVSKAALAFSAAALLATQPAQAAMGCWNAQQAAAAKVRDLQSRLMVAALRCRAIGIDVAGAYNDFVRRNRDALQATNGLIHARFETGYGQDADLYYDRFATSLANRYGGDATNGEICDEAASAAQEAAAAAGNLGKLLAIADRFGPAPELPGGACGMAEAAAPAAPPPPPPPTFAAAMDQALADVADPPRAPVSSPR
ncbi:MAG TPA: hypothetical protein VH331_15300 [Allosphingosinicella sp.]|jgi:hypothetical protein|nr:hypothetical protein [Allosphingosinicella sp.]